MEEELSDKSKYPTFARTSVISSEITPTIQELLNYFKWTKVAVIYENSTLYKKIFEEFKAKHKGEITIAKSVPRPYSTSFDQEYHIVRKHLREVSKRSKSKCFHLTHFEELTKAHCVNISYYLLTPLIIL